MASCALRWLAVCDIPRLMRAMLVIFFSSTTLASSLRKETDLSQKETTTDKGKSGRAVDPPRNSRVHLLCLPLNLTLAALQVQAGLLDGSQCSFVVCGARGGARQR